MALNSGGRYDFEKFYETQRKRAARQSHGNPGAESEAESGNRAELHEADILESDFTGT